MSAIDRDRHRPWLAYALEESLEHSLLTPKNVIDHANPEVLVNQLPAPVISLLLSRALTIGTFSAAQVLESVPPALLAEHLDPEVMWRCLKEAADRGGLSGKGGARSNPARQWFASVLGRALDSELITPGDLLRFLPPSEFVPAAPKAVLADLLGEALAKSRFDPELVLQHLTPTVIAESLETSLAWDCIAEAAGRHFGLGSLTAKASGPAPTKAAIGAATPVPMTPTATEVKSAVKSAVKPPEQEKPIVGGRLPNAIDDDRTPAPASFRPPTPATKSASGGPSSAGAEPPLARAAMAAPSSSLAAAATDRPDASDWTPADDGRRFPFPPAR